MKSENENEKNIHKPNGKLKKIVCNLFDCKIFQSGLTFI